MADEQTLRKTLASLDVQRKAMELEADAIFLELTTPPADGVEPMGINTPLVDREGYPRGDIDVYRARTQRGRFAVLKTDHKEIQGKIEGLLLQLARLKVRFAECSYDICQIIGESWVDQSHLLFFHCTTEPFQNKRRVGGKATTPRSETPSKIRSRHGKMGRQELGWIRFGRCRRGETFV